MSILLFFVALLFSYGCLCQNVHKLDSLMYSGSEGKHYVFSSGDVIEHIYLAKDTNIFRHDFRQHLNVVNCYGEYWLKEDTLVLECKINCNYDSSTLFMGPIIIPMADDRYQDTLLVSRADGSTNLIRTRLIRNGLTDSLIIIDIDRRYIEIMESPAKYYIVRLDYNFSLYNNFTNKEGVIRENSLIIGDRHYYLSNYPSFNNSPKRRKKLKSKHLSPSRRM